MNTRSGFNPYTVIVIHPGSAPMNSPVFGRHRVRPPHARPLLLSLTIGFGLVLAHASVQGAIAVEVPSSQSQPPAASSTPTDALGRNTPLGTITGFTSAVRHEDFATAREYMQL